MQDIFRDLPVFVEVARLKSFSRAAEVLDMPISTVSRRIAAMEKKLGAALLRRTTRSVELTAGGAAFFESCEAIVSELDNARESLLEEEQLLSGRIRLSMSPIIARFLSNTVFSSFARKFPGVRLNLYLNSRWVDLNSEPYDLEIRAGTLPDSSLRMHRLTTMRPGLYATPSLLARYKLPVRPQDLRGIPFISPVMPGHLTREMYRGEDSFKLPRRSEYVVSSLALALEFVLAGLGISSIAYSVVEPYVRSGELVRLLPEWRGENIDVSVVMPDRVPPRRVRLLVDHLVEYCARKNYNEPDPEEFKS